MNLTDIFFQKQQNKTILMACKIKEMHFLSSSNSEIQHQYSYWLLFFVFFLFCASYKNNLQNLTYFGILLCKQSYRIFAELAYNHGWLSTVVKSKKECLFLTFHQLKKRSIKPISTSILKRRLLRREELKKSLQKMVN